MYTFYGSWSPTVNHTAAQLREPIFHLARPFMRILRLLPAVAALFLVMFPRLAAQDEVRVTRLSDCCFSISLTNRNHGQLPLNGFTIKTTRGAVFLSSIVAPSGWNFAFPDPTKIEFSMPAGTLAYGATQAGFEVCVQSVTNDIELTWLTLSSGSNVTSGSISMQCRDIDSVTVSPSRNGTGGCAFVWTIKNKNPQRAALAGFSVRLLTPNHVWDSAATGPNRFWVFARTPSTVDFTTTAGNALQPDSVITGFLTSVFPAPLNDSILVEWTTRDAASGLVTRDTMTLRCFAPGCDDVGDTVDAADPCCRTFTIYNGHEPASPVNRIRFVVLTPGARIVGTPSGPWRLLGSTATDAVFDDPSSSLTPRGYATGFRFCFENAPGKRGPILVSWRTLFGRTILCEDTLLIAGCTSTATSYDELDVTASTPVSGACCTAMTLHNEHTPAGPLNGLRLKLLTPGAAFQGAPTGPWSRVSATATQAEFRSAASLSSGQALGGFVACIRPPGGSSATIVLEWESVLDGATIHRDTVSFPCDPPAETRCDSMTVAHVRDCEYTFGFVNTHLPQGPVNGYRLTILSAGASFAQKSTPAAWTITQQDASSVTWTSGSPVQPGGSSAQFGVTIAPVSAGSPVLVQRCTMLNGAVICCDSVTVSCTPAQTLCDSLEVVPKPELCTFTARIINRHTPKSAMNGFRISLTTPGSSVLAATAPAGWMVESRTGTTLTFRDTAGTLASGASAGGFEFALQAAAGNPNIFYQWCSLNDAQVICCASATVRCEEARVACDSFYIRPTSESCTFSASFFNRNTQQTVLDGFILRVLTPGAQITGATPPPGWRLATFSATQIVFSDSGSGVPSMGGKEGFQLSIKPMSGSSAIRLQWCTLNRGRDVCCDSALVECQTQVSSRDTVRLVPDAVRPCCYDIRVSNLHTPASPVSVFDVTVLTPDVVVLPLYIGGPPDWQYSYTAQKVTWSRTTTGILSGTTLGGFVVCFDNNKTQNAPFDIRWQTWDAGIVISSDTLNMACDRALDIERTSDALPAHLALREPFPNPAGDAATVEFDVHHTADIVLDVVNSEGRIVRTLAAGLRAPGVYHARWDASDLPAGLYLYRLSAEGRFVTRSFMILR